MDSGLGKQTGDIVSSKHSSQEEYYKYMLLKAKLEARENPGAHPLLQVRSEKEDIEFSILDNLIHITESSPEFSQIVDITGSRDRYEQARILAEVVYDKVRAEQILGFYTPDRNTLSAHFTARTNKATAQRTNGSRTMSSSLANATGRSATAAIGSALSNLTGGAVPQPPAQ